MSRLGKTVATILAMLALNSSLIRASTLVVLNKAEATASLIDIESGEGVATLPTGEGPHEADTTPDGKFVLCTNYGTAENPGSTLTLIDVAKAEVVKTIDLDVYRRPHGVRWLSDGRRAVVTVEDNMAVLIVDVEVGKVEKAIETDQEIRGRIA